MIGDTIRILRERAGYSQSELARRLSVTRSSVNAWESGLSALTEREIRILYELLDYFHQSKAGE